MLNFNINLTSLAIILWSGMLIIAGSIWVLSSQVRRLADIMEDRPRTPARLEEALEREVVALPGRVARRGASVRVRGPGRGALPAGRRQGQLTPPERGPALGSHLGLAQAADDRARS